MSYESELTSADVKAAAKKFGADLCGIGNMERWKGTLFSTYPTMGYAAINQVWGPVVMWPFCTWMEDHGYEVVPLRDTSKVPCLEDIKKMDQSFCLNAGQGWAGQSISGKSIPQV